MANSEWARSARARKDVPARRVHWYHPACIFKSFERASKKTKTIDTVEDMEGFSELKEADKADLTSRVAAWVARKAAMNANYKPKKRKRRGGDWLPSPTQSFDNTASFDNDEEDDAEEEADEEAVDLLVGLTQQRPAVARSPHDEGAAELLAALAGSPPPPSNAAPSSAVSETSPSATSSRRTTAARATGTPAELRRSTPGAMKFAYDDGEVRVGRVLGQRAARAFVVGARRRLRRRGAHGAAGERDGGRALRGPAKPAEQPSRSSRPPHPVEAAARRREGAARLELDTRS